MIHIPSIGQCFASATHRSFPQRRGFPLMKWIQLLSVRLRASDIEFMQSNAGDAALRQSR
jgi:hypothetical protein